MTTPKHIISTVVYTAAGLAALYVATLAGLLIWQVIATGRADKEVLTHFVNAGTTLLGFLSGMLVNTRTPGSPVSEVTVSTTTTEAGPDPKS